MTAEEVLINAEYRAWTRNLKRLSPEEQEIAVFVMTERTKRIPKEYSGLNADGTLHFQVRDDDGDSICFCEDEYMKELGIPRHLIRRVLKDRLPNGYQLSKKREDI